MTTPLRPTSVLGECQQCASVFVRWNEVSFCTNPECPCGNPLPADTDRRHVATRQHVLDRAPSLYAIELAVRRDFRDEPEFIGERFVASPARTSQPHVPSIRDAKWMTNPIDAARLAMRVGGKPWAVQFGPVIL